MPGSAPLTQEYAKSTESNLDQGKADDLRSREKRELQQNSSASSASSPAPAKDEHPISVGKS